MNPNKYRSDTQGRQFLAQALASEQQALASQLELSTRTLTHNGRMGEVNEQLSHRYILAESVYAGFEMRRRGTSDA